jgi:hypothetical protein
MRGPEGSVRGPELPFPVMMTRVGRSRSLIRLGRITKPERVLQTQLRLHRVARQSAMRHSSWRSGR